MYKNFKKHFINFKNIKAMYPKIKIHGWKYFFDERYRKTCRNRDRRHLLGNYFYNNRKRIRQNLYKKNKICFYCNQFIKFKDSTIDHIKPISENGSHNLKNLRLIHDKCRIERDRIINKEKLSNKEIMFFDLEKTIENLNNVF